MAGSEYGRERAATSSWTTGTCHGSAFDSRIVLTEEEVEEEVEVVEEEEPVAVPMGSLLRDM